MSDQYARICYCCPPIPSQLFSSPRILISSLLHSFLSLMHNPSTSYNLSLNCWFSRTKREQFSPHSAQSPFAEAGVLLLNILILSSSSIPIPIPIPIIPSDFGQVPFASAVLVRSIRLINLPIVLSRLAIFRLIFWIRESLMSIADLIAWIARACSSAASCHTRTVTDSAADFKVVIVLSKSWGEAWASPSFISTLGDLGISNVLRRELRRVARGD